MFKRGLIFFIGLLYAIPVLATTNDTINTSPPKIDTTLINQYRIEPRKNAIPSRTRPVIIDQELIPVNLPDYHVSYWHKWYTWALNFNQSGFTNNWTGGGVSAIALGTNFDFKTEYNKAPLDYTSELNLIYGASKNKGQGTRKTNDRIFFDNKIATQLSKTWFFFGSLTFESQFDNGFTYQDPLPPILISRFMSPGYLTESLGFEYKPSKYFDLRLGTGTARQTFVLDTAIYHNLSTNYGVKPGNTFLNQLAFQVVSTFDKDIMTNLHLNARYALFIPYQQALAYTTHRLDMTLTAKVNRLINVSMNGTLLYDKNTSDRAQGTEGLALGVIYKFP